MDTSVSTPQATETPVTVVTQTRVLPEREDDFRVLQQRINDAVASFPGLLDHRVISAPAPPQ